MISRVSRHIKSRQRVFHSRATRRLASPRLASNCVASRRFAFTSPLGHPVRVFVSAFRENGDDAMRRGATRRDTMRCDADSRPARGQFSNPARTAHVRMRRYYGYFSSRMPTLTRYYCGCNSLSSAHRPTKVYCVTLWLIALHDPLNKQVPSVTNKYPISS